MRTEEEQRAQLYQVATSHPDEATRAKARELLDALPKHPADTRETDFVDRVEGDKAVLLDRTGAPRNVPAGNLREGQDVRRAPVNYTPSMRDPDEQTNVIPSPISRSSRVIGAVGSAASKVNHAAGDEVPYLISRFGNGLTLGASDALGDLIGTDSPANRAAASKKASVDLGLGDIPLGPAAEFAGSLSPIGAPAAVARGLESAAANLASRSPRVMALLGRAAAVPGAKVVSRAATGAAMGGGLGAVTGAANSRGDLYQMADDALEGFKGGAATGAVLGAGSRIASGVAGAARTPDIALLESYDMKPGVVPGRPVANKGEGFTTQLINTLRRRAPATGVMKATPATAEKAAIDAMRPVTDDLATRQGVNQARIAELRAGNEERFPNTVPVEPQQAALKRLENAPGTSRSNRSRARDLQAQIDKFSVADADRTVPVRNVPMEEPIKPQGEPGPVAPSSRAPIAKDPQYQVAVENLGRKISSGKGTAQDLAAYEALTLPPEASPDSAVPRALPMGIKPTDLQQIRDAADSYAKQDRRAISKVPKDANEMAQIAKTMQKALPRAMQVQDRNYSQATGRIEDAKRALGLGNRPLRLDGTELAIKAGKRAALAARNTPEGVRAAEQIAALRESGPPAVMKSAARTAPAPIDLGSRIDVPKLHVAQQNMQADPGTLLTDGLLKSIPRAARAFGQRMIYPTASKAAGMRVPTAAVGIDRLIRALRGRQEQDTQE